MKAAICPKSGPPEVLQYTDVDKPSPRAREILVRVHSTTVTSGDVNMRRLPRILLWTVGAVFGFKPMRIPGVEYAGEVVEVGSEVRDFAPGQTVCGTTTGLRNGANAEYVCVPVQPKQGVLARKPDALSYDHAATATVGAMTAMQLIGGAGVQPGEWSGQQVLVYGASGSVGSYAVQLAKHYGAEVTAVCSTANIELVRSIGADHAIDYTKEDFTRDGRRYDLIFDAVGKLSKAKCKDSLSPTGRYSSVRRPTKEKQEELEQILRLVAAGAIRPVIDREFPLSQIVEAHRYAESKRKKGNVIVRVAE